MSNKRVRLERLKKANKPCNQVRVVFRQCGDPEPEYEPGERVIRWSVDDEITAETIREKDCNSKASGEALHG